MESLFPPEIEHCTPEECARQIDAAIKLKHEIESVVRTGTKYFRIPSGNYRFTERLGLLIDGASDLELEATGATFWFVPRSCGVHFRNCRGVKLRGLTCDMTELPFLQGVICDIDPGKRKFSVRLSDYFVERYLHRPAGLQRFRVMFLDETGMRETDNIDFRPEIESIKFNGVDTLEIPVYDFVAEHWRYQMRPPRIGDRIVMGMRQEGGVLLADGCGEMEFTDITVFAACGFAFFEKGHGDGGNRYRNCRLIRRPNTARLLAGAADCFHSLTQKRGPIVENCEFSWALDDLMNIHGFWHVVLQLLAPDELIVGAPFGTRLEPGEELTFYAPPYGVKRSAATILDTYSLPREMAEFEPEVQGWYRKKFAIELRDMPESSPCRVRLDRPVPVDQFDLAATYAACGEGAQIRNNHLHDGHVRGILLKSRNCVIHGNRIERIALSGIILKPELYWLEGPMAKQISIRKNELCDCSFDHAGIAAITVMSGFCPPPCDRFTAAINQENIEISGNRIDGCHAGPGILLANCRNGKINGNCMENLYSNCNAATSESLTDRLDRTGETCNFGTFQPTGVQLIACDNAICSENRVDDMRLPEVQNGPWCR